MKNRLLNLLIVSILLSLTSCKQTPTDTIYNNYYTIVADSLENPNVMPNVVFTRPADHATGPFENMDPTQPQTHPTITIQLNKMVNVMVLKTSTITLSQDAENIPIQLSDMVYQSGYSYQDPIIRNILVYSVQDRYYAGKTYSLIVDTTLIDIHGNRLSKSFTISYMPEPSFRVAIVSPVQNSVEPDDYYPSTYSQKITVVFNSRVDSSILSNLSIFPAIVGNWAPSNSYYDDSTAVEFDQTAPLAYSAQYVVFVSSSSKDANGMLIKAPYQFAFSTSPFNAQINGWSSSQGPGGFNVVNRMNFIFNGPLDTSTVRSAILVTPTVAYTISFSSYRSFYKYDEVELDFDTQQFQRNTKYTITFKPTVRSLQGDFIKQYEYSFTTGT